MKSKYIAIGMLLVLIALLPSIVLATPHYEDNITVGKASQSEYNPNYAVSFEINWTEHNMTGGAPGRINASHVWFETNITGTLTNYTNATTSPYQVKNESTYLFTINFTEVKFQKAANYSFRWIASNATNFYENATDTMYYTLAKNVSVPVVMNLTVYAQGDTQSNVSRANAQSFQGQGNPWVDAWMILNNGTDKLDANGDTIGTVACYRDEVSWTKGSTGALSLGVASYTVKCNSTGTTNYTTNSSGASFTLSVLAAGGGGAYGTPVITTTVFSVTEEREEVDIITKLKDNPLVLVIVLVLIFAAFSGGKRR